MYNFKGQPFDDRIYREHMSNILWSFWNIFLWFTEHIEHICCFIDNHYFIMIGYSWHKISQPFPYKTNMISVKIKNKQTKNKTWWLQEHLIIHVFELFYWLLIGKFAMVQTMVWHRINERPLGKQVMIQIIDIQKEDIRKDHFYICATPCLSINIINYQSVIPSQIAKFMWPTWGPPGGPVSPRWAPHWPHEPCYQGCVISQTTQHSHVCQLLWLSFWSWTTLSHAYWLPYDVIISTSTASIISLLFSQPLM